jgi:hypothetical protein
MTSYSDMSYLSYCLSVSFCISSFAKKVIFGFFLFYGFFSEKKVIFGFLKSEKKTLLYTLLGAQWKPHPGRAPGTPSAHVSGLGCSTTPLAKPP